MKTLTEAQRYEIADILKRDQGEIDSAKRATMEERARFEKAQGTPELAEISGNMWVTTATLLLQIKERNTLLAVLSPEQMQEFVPLACAVPHTQELPYFEPSKVKQEQPVWCWVACLQMLLRYNGVAMSQDDIATEIFGDTIPYPATAEEMAGKISGVRFNFKTPAHTWLAECQHFTGSPPGDMIVGLMQRGRLILVGIDHSHVCVIHNVSYFETDLAYKSPFLLGERNRLTSIIAYDPLDSLDKNLSWEEAQQRITDWWYAFAQISGAATF